MTSVQFNKRLNDIIKEKCNCLDEYYGGFRKDVNNAIIEIVLEKQRALLGGEQTEVNKKIENSCTAIVNKLQHKKQNMEAGAS